MKTRKGSTTNSQSIAQGELFALNTNTQTREQKEKSLLPAVPAKGAPGAKNKTLEELVFDKKTTPNKKREQNRLLKKSYEDNKQRLLKLEHCNYEYILLIRTQDNWYKMVAHSAVLFLYYVTPIAREKFDEEFHPPKLLRDTDFRYKAPIGVLSFKEIDKLKKIMYCCGFEPIKVVDTEWITAFKLDRKMSEKEFWDLVKQEEELWDKINRTIVPEACYPNLGVDIQEAIKLIYDVVRKFSKDARELTGYKLLKEMSDLLSEMLAAEKGYSTWEEFFALAPMILMSAQANITIMSAVRLADKNILIRMAEAVKRIEGDLAQAQRSYEKEL